MTKYQIYTSEHSYAMWMKLQLRYQFLYEHITPYKVRFQYFTGIKNNIYSIYRFLPNLKIYD